MPPRRRRRFDGLYYHSSPPRVVYLNSPMINNKNVNRRREVDEFSIKLSTIRIWMHEKDIANLTRILWAGQGNRLRQQASTNPRIKRFLNVVPHAMNSIKDVHQAVVDNNLEELQSKLEPPVPPALITSRDVNGLNLMHKAAGLGRASILEYLITSWPEGVHETDITGKTALHWAASAKNNQRCYTLLTAAGADEDALDYKMKTPAYYRHKSNDIERTFLMYIPEAPRVPPDQIPDWDALIDNNSAHGQNKKPIIKIPPINVSNGSSNLESNGNENASETDVTESNTSAMEDEEPVTAVNSNVFARNSDLTSKLGSEEDSRPDVDETPKIPNGNEDHEDGIDVNTNPVNEENHKDDNGTEADDLQQQQDPYNNHKDNDNDDGINDSETKQIDNLQEMENVPDNTDVGDDEKQLQITASTIGEDTINETNHIESTQSAKDQELQEIPEIETQKGCDDFENHLDNTNEEQLNDSYNKDSKGKESLDNEIHLETEESLKNPVISEENLINGSETSRETDNESDNNNESMVKVLVNGYKDDDSSKDNKEVKVELMDRLEPPKTAVIRTNANYGNDIIDNDNLKDNLEVIPNHKDEIFGEMALNRTFNKNSNEKEIDNNKEIKSDSADENLEETPNTKDELDKAEEDTSKDVQKSINQSTDPKDVENEFSVKSKESTTEVGVFIKDIGHKMENKVHDIKDFVNDLKTKTENSFKKVFTTNNNTITAEANNLDDNTWNEGGENRKNPDIINLEGKENIKSFSNLKDHDADGDGDDDDEDDEVIPAINTSSYMKANEEPLNEFNETSVENIKVMDGFHEDSSSEDLKEAAMLTSDGKTFIPALENTNGQGFVLEQPENNQISPTSSRAIEGFVQGQPEITVVKSEMDAAFATADDEEVQLENIIAAGDVEKLAEIVLNGEGEKLLHLKAKQPEVQAFLNNVSGYMNKIQRVHEAARGGSLLSLQQALDRRKFAIAKYSESANGATPLHVAILFGHTDIVRYLSSRFPETTSIADANGRTPLHYAAVIDDNGHFYNILLRAGANPNAKDKFGCTPKQYINDENLKTHFNYHQLLRDFNAEEMAKDMLHDRVPDDLYSSRRLLQDMDIIETLERCYSVIQDSSRVWENMMVPTATGGHQLPPVGTVTTLQLAITSYLSRFLKPTIYESIKLRQTRQDHTLFDIIWPALRKTSKERPLEEDINCGLIAPDYDVYIVFQEFLIPLIKDMHGLNASTVFAPHPTTCYFPNANTPPAEGSVHFIWNQSVAHLVERCTLECSRNLNDFELPLNLTYDQLDQVEQIIMMEFFKPEFTEVISETEPGSYYALAEIFAENSKTATILETSGLLIPLLRNSNVDEVQIAESASFNGTLWPYGRGVYISASRNLAIWVNCQDHLRIITCTNTSKRYDDIGSVYTLIGRTVSYLQQHLNFKFSYFLGYLQARPAYLGTGLKITTSVHLPHFMSDVHNLRHMCSLRGLHLFTTANHPTQTPSVRIANMQSLGLNEFSLFQDYCAALNNLLTQERRQSESDTQQVAALLNDMFHRRRENQHFQDNDIFQTEQGQYLADNLAEPLIKALTQIASKRPEDPLLYLTNYLQDYIHTRNHDQTGPNNEQTQQIAVRAGSTQTVSTATIDSVSPVNRKAVKHNGANKQAVIAHMEDIVEYEDESSELKTNGDSPDTLAAKMMEQRDEHGQSMLHFACARSNRKGTLITMIEESQVDITYRDELYRTARDVSLQANQLSNAKEIDRYVLSLAVVGDVKPFQHFANSGYDHILDIFDDEENVSILDLVQQHDHKELMEFLQNLHVLEELREELHTMVRTSNMDRIKDLVETPEGKWLIKAKNYYGRTALHIAVLKESLEIAEYFMQICPEAVKIGDNLERTVLHYAMGTNSIENLSRILIQNGAKRISKDLKGRQPSYYFMNKADILRLQEEEIENR